MLWTLNHSPKRGQKNFNFFSNLSIFPDRIFRKYSYFSHFGESSHQKKNLQERYFKSGNHPWEDLAKSGYKPNMKYKSLIILLYFGYTLKK